METKNTILMNYARSIMEASTGIANTAATLNSNDEENNAIIKTMNVLVESLRSQTIIIQQAIDEYN